MIFGSKTRFPYRVRIHDKECGAVARALHHKTKIDSLSAVLENVSGTTFERKLMSRITFKRLALALVASLSFSVLATGPSNATQDEALTVTPSATSVGLGESITATIDVSFISDSALESVLVRVTKSGGAAAFTATTLIPLTTDSANVGGHGLVTLLAAQAFGYQEIDTTVRGDTFVATAAATYTRAKWTLRLSDASTAGTATYTVSLQSGTGGANGATVVVEKAASFSVTVTAADTTGVAAKTLMYLNETSAVMNAPLRSNGLGYISADSTLVVNAGSPTNPRVVGTVFIEPRNASDTRTSTASRLTGATDVTSTVNVQITGAGLLSVGSGDRGVSVSAGFGETVSVWSNGTNGTATITGFMGGVALTQAAKTVTFVGLADTFIPTVTNKTIAASGTTTGAITFVAKDSAGNAINGTNTQYRTGTPGAFYLVVADTTVVGSSWSSSDRGAGLTTAWSACTYVTADAEWSCDIPATESGVVTTLYIADSKTASSAVKKSEAMTLTAAGTGYTGTASFDKTTYNIGEKAILTLTSKDSGGRNVPDGDSAPWATSARFGSTSATFVASTGSDLAGAVALTSNLIAIINSDAITNTYVGGVETVVAYMPTIAGTYTVLAKDKAGSGTESVILTWTVVDPGQAATLAAAEAATDAAAEAIDAANAATDAANLSAEAADAATVAAEEARDAADAATAAVEELATAVATLMAALKAQVTTLANTVAKIAKKVGVKK